ncbi:MAG: hypothetical protein HGB12_01740, partial [Bacteroidetes bacterium]|nr:hypothetical protein [Bacteroidota bacterium]
MKNNSMRTKKTFMIQKCIAFALLVINCQFLIIYSNAQGIAINITGAAADNSAMLDISSSVAGPSGATGSRMGILIPRISLSSNSDVSGFNTPLATSLMVYNDGVSGLSPAGFYYWNGTQWIQAMGPQGPTGNNGAAGSTGATGLLGTGTATGNTTYWDGSQWALNSSNIYNAGGNVGIGTTSPEFKLTLDKGATTPDGGILALGTYGSGTDLSSTGAGSKLIWYPKKGAFRAGYVDGTQWNNANIGDYSTSLGHCTKANGTYSVAMGDWTTASGNYSIAMGWGTKAVGTYSLAMGSATEANGHLSVAMGLSSVANGEASVAIGRSTRANGLYSTAIGYDNTAGGIVSVAIGNGNTASGNFSTALGLITTASSYGSFTLGRYNVGGGTADSWVDTDPIFEIGIGSGTGVNAANAMTVLKNGNVGIGNINPGQKLTIEGTIGILESGTSPTYHTIFQGGNQNANITYTLPVVQASASGQLLQNDGSGVLSWAASGVPSGAVLMWAGLFNAIPSGWLLADGSAVSRSTYSNLYSAIGTTYGVGNGSTTFNLPKSSMSYGNRFQVDNSGSLTTGLVSYWDMEGNSNDLWGSSNGTNTSITFSSANGKISQGAGFNGSSSKITGTVTMPTSAYTVSAWLYWGGSGSSTSN